MEHFDGGLIHGNLLSLWMRPQASEATDSQSTSATASAPSSQAVLALASPVPVLAVYVTPPSPHRPPWQESETADEPIEETEATYEALKALNLQSVPETLLDLQTAFRSHFMTSTANLDTAEKAAFRDSCLRARRVLLALIRQRTAPISTR